MARGTKEYEIDLPVVVDRKGSRRNKVFALTVFTLALVAAIAILAFSTHAAVSFQSLTQIGAHKYMRYGDYTTFKTVYNEYFQVSENGRAYAGGYMVNKDKFQVLSANNNQGVVNYGDKITLVGSNDKYVTVEDSGALTCREAKVKNGAIYIVVGGSGPVKYGDSVSLQSMFGYVTATAEGVRGDTAEISSLEKYVVGRPGEEDGIRAHVAMYYGDIVKLRNTYNEFLQTDNNGWVYVRSDNGQWSQFAVLSPIHREGPVRYGDEVYLRGQTGNMVYCRDEGLTTALLGKATPFTVIGGNGLVRAGDGVAFRAESGYYINADNSGYRATLDESGHYSPSDNFELIFV